MSHLGTWVSALVDGQLPPADAERALAHVAACPACADELAAARQARRVLSVSADVTPDPELTARLLALAAQASPPPPATGRRDRRPAVPLGESAFAVPAKALSGDLLGSRRSPRHLVAGALAGAGVAVASLLVLGDGPVVVPATHPAQALTALGRAPHEAPVHRGVAETQLMATLATTGGTPAGRTATGGDASTDAAVLGWMRDQGWACPDALPTGYRVTAVRLDEAEDPLLEVDLAGPHGRVVLTEQRGRLDVASLGPAEERTIDGRTLYVLSRQPWHAVWQSDDTVVSLVSEAPQEHAAELVQHFPVTGYDDGIPARLARGWETVTGALAIP